MYVHNWSLSIHYGNHYTPSIIYTPPYVHTMLPGRLESLQLLTTLLTEWYHHVTLSTALL